MSNLIKRTVAVLLVFTLVSISIIPVSASSFDIGYFNFYNLLDFDTDDDNNVGTVNSNLFKDFDYTLPVKSVINYIDVVVSSAKLCTVGNFTQHTKAIVIKNIATICQTFQAYCFFVFIFSPPVKSRSFIQVFRILSAF